LFLPTLRLHAEKGNWRMKVKPVLIGYESET